MNSRAALLLASDVDKTLLAPHECLGGELLAAISKLLALREIRLVIVTGNDYERVQRKRIVEPIAAELRRDLIVYSDGCTRRLKFDSEGQEIEDCDYRSQVALEPGDKEVIRRLLHSKFEDWDRRYPDLCNPTVEIEARSEGTIEVSIGPINVNDPLREARREEFQEVILQELDQYFQNVQLLPSDKLWIRIQCKRSKGELASIPPEQAVARLLQQILGKEVFSDLARPTIVDRGEQIVVKPIKIINETKVDSPEKVLNKMVDIRQTLAREIEGELSGRRRLTCGEYGVLVGGRVTIDIQKKGIDKAFAMRDLKESLDYRGEVLYFGDAFGEQGNDRPVAKVEGVQCISVGEAEDIPERVLRIGGGPLMTEAYLKGILWALTGYTQKK